MFVNFVHQPVNRSERIISEEKIKLGSLYHYENQQESKNRHCLESTEGQSKKEIEKVAVEKNNNNGSNQSSKEVKQTRILIAESEPELLTLFKTYLDSLGVQSVAVDNADEFLSAFLQSKNEGKDYDAILLDTHLKGKKDLDVAKKIRENNKRQKILLVTTSMKDQLPVHELQSAAIDEKDILVMPFALSKLYKLLINNTILS